MSRPLQPVAAWARYSTWALSFVGLALGTYLTIAHFVGNQILACSGTGVVDCEAVTSSPQSYIFHIPVAEWGLAAYLVMVVINSPWGWRSTRYWLHVVRFAFTAVSMLLVFWLVYAELVLINHICLYCTGVHIVTLSLLIILSRVSPLQLGWTVDASSK